MSAGRRHPSANRPIPFVSCLDDPLAQIAPGAWVTPRIATEAIHGFGRIGAGKSSAAWVIAGAYMRAGMGGLVCIAKPEEVNLWRECARRNGREQSLIIFDERHGFNFISYELARQGMKGIGTVTECIMRILEASDHAMRVSGQSNDPFWGEAIRQVLNYAIPLLYSAYGKATISDIIDFVVSAATKPEQYTDPAFLEKSLAGQTMRKATNDPAVRIPEAELTTLLDYWFRQYTTIPEKTRGNIVISLSTKLDRFKHGRLKSMFCEHTTIVPEMCFHGAIIILNIPVLTNNEDGIIAQQLFKFMWQRAVESRNALDPRHRERFLFLWCDEAHYFVNLKDDEFLATCRASRACVVFLSQNLPSYYSRLGEKNRDAVDGLVNKFSTHLFFQNVCNRTNKFASDLIGRDLVVRATQARSTGRNTSRGMNESASENRGSNSGHGSSYGGKSSGFNSNSGSNKGSGENWGVNIGKGTNEGESYSEAETMDNILEPRFFTANLKTGGPANGNLVSAVWFQAGARFPSADGRNWIIARFRQ